LYINFKPHYIYNTRHGVLEINEPFTAIFNSAHIWKFVQPDKVAEAYKSTGSLPWHKPSVYS